MGSRPLSAAAELIVKARDQHILVLSMCNATNTSRQQIFLPGDDISLIVTKGRSVSVTEVQADHPAVTAEKLDRERKAEEATRLRQELHPEIGTKPLPKITQSDAGNDIA